MARYFCLALLLVWTPTAAAQLEPPVSDRPADFSNIVGKYKIEISAEPTEVHVEDAITLRVQIIGEGAEKYQPNRRHLRLFPESWKDDFHVQEMQDKNEVLPDKKTWVFVYRLKPKHVKVDTIEDIKLVYYDPNIARKNKYVTQYATSIKITVKPKPEALEPELDVRAVPESFYVCAESSAVLARSTPGFPPTGFQLALLLTAPPVACLVAGFAWRRFFPDEIRRARRQRGAAARRAHGQLQAGGATAWDVVRRYLHERFDFPASDPTPTETAGFLKRRGFAKELCEQTRAFFQACDAERFTTGAESNRKHLADAAVRLIEALEADPCARV
jgi:hypothetical protein